MPRQARDATFCLAMLALALLGNADLGTAAVWQWSAAVPGGRSTETDAAPRAFLWIPPACQRVRAVVVGQHNMEEEFILEHSGFRDALAELSMAAIWVTPPFDHVFRFDRGAGERFEAMMRALATESGYAELEFAPIVPLGHSAAASFPWNFAVWNPRRTLAAISVSGQWPLWDDPSMPVWGDRTIDGVPGLVTMGEYEWAEERAAEGLRQRAAHPAWALSMLAEPGGGHFDASDAKVEFLSLYLRKAAEHRLPADWPVDAAPTLTTIDPRRHGWLVDRWRRDEPPSAATAPLNEYAGNASQAFWCFDDEMARAIDAFGARDRGKAVQLLGYVQDGDVVSQVPGTHQQVTLAFKPRGEDLTFRLEGAFLNVVPLGRPERWTGERAGAAIGHAGGDAVRIERICGPVERLDAHTFAVRFDRVGLNNVKRSREIWLLASHPGDKRYRRAVQQAVMHIPLRQTKGPAPGIEFPALEDQTENGGPISLAAVSDDSAPVHYYVLAGPAEVDGNQLTLARIPPRARFPVKVTVVAWQWTFGAEGRLQAANTFERSFFIHRQKQKS